MKKLHKKFLLDISSFVFKAYSKQSSVTLLPTGIIFAGIVNKIQLHAIFIFV